MGLGAYYGREPLRPGLFTDLRALGRGTGPPSNWYGCSHHRASAVPSIGGQRLAKADSSVTVASHPASDDDGHSQ